VRDYLSRTPTLAAIYLPGDVPSDATRAANVGAFGALIVSGKPQIFAAAYPYNVAPVSDNSPFFFFTFKTRDLFREILHPASRGIDWKVNLGVAVIFMLLGISIVAVLAFLILPMALHAPARAVQTLPLLYFLALGLGYILVEITLIQRFVLFLGNPVYALTVVIFLMLLASGLGSLAARRWMRSWLAVLGPLVYIVALLIVYWRLLPGFLAAQVGMAFGPKLALSALLLFPAGFVMGMPFPTGLRALAASRAEASSLEWAWAMNAAASVLGSVAAIVIAVNFGLGVTLLLGAGVYVLAALLVPTFKARALA
jgi:hypothetical protein